MRCVLRRSGSTLEEVGLFTSADEVLAYIKAENVKFVDIRFCDLPGVMQHLSLIHI